MKDLVRKVVPARVRQKLRRTYERIRYRGKNRFCPVCGSYSARFAPGGKGTVRPDSRCPDCGALERHRLIAVFLKDWTDLYEGHGYTFLHVAPEPSLEREFRQIPNLDYITADLLDPRAMVRMDITDIQYPNDYFDIIYCSHVLEHVQDDQKAMREFARVLKSTGWAVLQVPISGEVTFEDVNVVDPKERFRLFGQEDHVRRYGYDYKDRLTWSGFIVQEIASETVVDSDNITLMRINKGEKIFFCTKQRNSIYQKVKEKLLQSEKA
jgi:SAM-dependent methyltransferase